MWARALRWVAPRSGSSPAALLATAILVAGSATGSWALGGESRPVPSGEVLPSGKREDVEVRLVQVDISVLPPGSKTHASVPGLSLEHFEVWLDGKRLDDKPDSGLIFDTLCAQAEGQGERPPATTQAVEERERRIIAVVDFNYLDARGRFRVAEAIEKVAEKAGKGPEVYKVYGLTRQVYELTSGFTRDPQVLGRVADAIRVTSHRATHSREIPGVFVFARPTRSDGSLVYRDRPAESALEAALGISDQFLDAVSSYDPGASVAALEAILRANSAWQGRQVAILFTGEGFRMVREERIAFVARGLKEMFRHGFTVWTVDAEGLSRREASRSRLLSMIARESGGDSIRYTGHLDAAFRGASEQLSCYYLLSVPVAIEPGTSRRHFLNVKVDTVKHPELWGHRIIAADQVQAVDKITRRRSQRMAALFSPLDFDTPPVDLLVSYPVVRGDERVLPVSLRVPLAALDWTASDKGVQASVLVDLIVERDTGRGTELVCKIGPEDLNRLDFQLRRKPREDQGADLVFELSCPLSKDGFYTARGVVTDLASYSLGAGISAVQTVGSLGEEWSVPVARVEASSGKDFVWRPGTKTVRRDKGRASWRSVAPGQQVAPGDRVGLRHVICGPDRSKAPERFRHFLLRIVDPATREVQTAFTPEAVQVLGGEVEGPFCAAATVMIPEYSLPPGRYEWLITEADFDPGRAAPGPDAQEGSGQIVERVSFTVGR
ncbi:MAG: hypothetical protein Q9Q40_04305 [Acidobacteriota bacterium]|nr:hypothetical protein [Acidobacteriota bacterium]MDQ7088164.1 hypothetical protein [Acidobacteriota bacterium]